MGLFRICEEVADGQLRILEEFESTQDRADIQFKQASFCSTNDLVLVKWDPMNHHVVFYGNLHEGQWEIVDRRTPFIESA